MIKLGYSCIFFSLALAYYIAAPLFRHATGPHHPMRRRSHEDTQVRNNREGG